MNFKDLFSGQASSYARFRPRYPAPLFAWLGRLVERRQLAVDVGSGNGQAATDLAAEFERVVAIDPSASQLAARSGPTFWPDSAKNGGKVDVTF